MATLVGIAVSASTVALADTLQFAIMLSVMSNLCQYYYRLAATRSGGHAGRYGPFYLMLIATILLLTPVAKSSAVNLVMESFKHEGYDNFIGTVLDVTSTGGMDARRMQVMTALGYVCLVGATFLGIKSGSDPILPFSSSKSKGSETN